MMSAPRRTLLSLGDAVPASSVQAHLRETQRASADVETRRMLLRSGAACVLIGLAPARAAEAADAAPTLPAEVASELSGAQALGAAKLRFLGMDIYEARLWSRAGLNPASYAQSPFALELNYFRSLSGRLIAERSLKEMQRQGKQDSAREQAWLQAMVLAFPDVKAGDRITGLHAPGVGARFWFNGQSRPEVRDAEFSRAFFGIWLSEASSEPAMRKSLLGQKAA